MLTDNGNTYTYDYHNRQISMTGSGGTAEYVYDAFGRRVAKVVDGVTTYYLYNNRYQVLEERDGTDALAARYLYASYIDEPLTMERSGVTYTYHRDAQFSLTEMTDSNGTLVERYEYDVYGEARLFDGAGNTLTTSAIGNPYLYTARRYDAESGNYYFRARMYSAGIGRFLQMDPLGYVDGMNLYTYSRNRPTRFFDPTGLSADECSEDKCKKEKDKGKLTGDLDMRPFIVDILKCIAKKYGDIHVNSGKRTIDEHANAMWNNNLVNRDTLNRVYKFSKTQIDSIMNKIGTQRRNELIIVITKLRKQDYII